MATTVRTQTWLISAAALFVFMWVYDFAFHVFGMMDLYLQTPRVWRSEASMQDVTFWSPIQGAVLALLISRVYLQWRPSQKTGKVGSSTCPYRRSMGFGLYTGLLIAITYASFYIYLPIPESVPVFWLIGETVRGVLMGLVLEFFYRKPTKATKA